MHRLPVMPPQRRLIRERLVALTALERLPGMRHQMPAQARSVTEHFRTQRAIVQLNIRRIRVHVRPQVHPERFLLREPFRTVRTIVGFLSGVRHQVTEEDFFLRKAFLAHLALEWTFARVDSLVADECGTGREPFLADAATEAALLHVDRGVSAELDAAGEGFRTVRTLEDFQFSVFVYLEFFK